MLDYGPILFLVNYVCTYSLYARTMIFAVDQSELYPLYIKSQIGAYNKNVKVVNSK